MSTPPLEITPRTVRQLLKHWHATEQLGKHPLANLNVVAVRQQSAGYADSLVGRGLAIKGILHDAIEQLRPEPDTDPDPTNKRWRPYIIMTERYGLGRIPEWVASQLHIAQRTYYKEEKKGVERITHQLAHWEAECESVQPAQQTAPAKFLFRGPLLPTHPIIGRDGVLADLRALLIDGDVRAVALHGLPGVGKTTLAVELAHDPDLRDYFSDGVLWLGVGFTPDLASIIASVARQLELDADEPDTDQLLAEVREQIAKQKLLLILDDVWHTQTALTLCLGGPQARHLITTRSSAVAHETAASSTVLLDPLSADSGTSLLTQLAPAALYDRPELSQLHDRVNGLPLALVMIGKQLQKRPHIPPESRAVQLLQQLTQREERLKLAGLRSNAADHLQFESTSLAAVIGSSLDALPVQQQQALADLTVLPPKPNSFSAESAAAITQSDEQTIEALIDAGLVEPVGDYRLTIHQLIHDYVVVYRPSARTGRSLSQHFAAACLAGRHQFNLLELEQQNIQVALQRAIDQTYLADTADILAAYVPFLLDRGRGTDAEAWLIKAKKLAGGYAESAALASLQINHAQLARWKSDNPAALDHLQASWQLAEAHGHIDLLLTSKIMQLEIRLQNGETAAALELATDLQQSLEQLKDVRQRAAAYRSMSAAYYFSGDQRMAFATVDRARELYEQVKDGTALGRVYQNLGVLAIDQGRFNEGQLFYEMAFEKYQRSGNQSGVGHVINNMGVVAMNTGQWRRAADLHQRALALRHEMGDGSGEAQSLLNLSVVALACRNRQAAAGYLEQGLALVEQHGWESRKVKFLINLSWLKRQQKAHADALAVAQQAHALAEKIEQAQSVGDSLLQIGLAHAGLRDWDAAERALRQTADIFLGREQPQLVAEARAYLAYVYLQKEELEQALACLESVLPALEASLDGFEDAAALLLIGHQVLDVFGDRDQAAELKARAALLIRQQAKQIDDQDIRVAFLSDYQL